MSNLSRVLNGRLMFGTALLFILASIITAYGIHLTNAERERIAADFRTEMLLADDQVTSRLNQTLGLIYDGIRTMARLPGVQQACRVRVAPSGDARVTIQELYNSLASHVSMSEVYIVPADLDPDAGSVREPLDSFDQLITGRTSAKTVEKANGTPPSGMTLEETETFEYRLIRDQLAWFRSHPQATVVDNSLHLPLLSGKPVITCDNSRMDANRRDDADRTGLVMSVPVLDADGTLHGCISAIILNRALIDLLPDGTYALTSPGQSIVIANQDPAASWRRSRDAVASGTVDQELAYCDVRKVDLPDQSGAWLVWHGLAWTRPPWQGCRRSPPNVC